MNGTHAMYDVLLHLKQAISQGYSHAVQHGWSAATGSLTTGAWRELVDRMGTNLSVMTGLKK
jgi:hypothetical protein